MRGIVTAALLVLLCAACSSGRQAGERTVACTARITWAGTVYYAYTLESARPGALTLGTGGRPTCTGTNGGEAGASSTVEVRKLPRIDPEVAVGVRGEPEHAYLAEQYYRKAPKQPLRELVPPPIAPA
jgi:hypothetical protein